ELLGIGEKYGKNPAQVIIRWITQRGISAASKTTHKERMLENISVFDFSLTEEEMATVAALDRGCSVFYSHEDPVTVENFWRSIEKQNGVR
ncbi:MAG: aldo/keto reductase, partial [Clostridia bacterium]|nr:aldo/keto reductase [Clostridia bacterium]